MQKNVWCKTGDFSSLALTNEFPNYQNFTIEQGNIFVIWRIRSLVSIGNHLALHYSKELNMQWTFEEKKIISEGLYPANSGMLLL